MIKLSITRNANMHFKQFENTGLQLYFKKIIVFLVIIVSYIPLSQCLICRIAHKLYISINSLEANYIVSGIHLLVDDLFFVL